MEKTVNTIGQTMVEPNDEKVVVTDDALTVSMKEKDFSIAVTKQIQRATEYWAKFNYATRQELNYKYWHGDQVDKSLLRDDLEKGVENAIFRNLETFIPIATSRTPEVSATPAYKNKDTRGFAMDVRRTLQTEWEVNQGMGPKMSIGIRNHQINFIALYKVGYDPETGEYWTKEVKATDCVISKNGDFIAQYIKDKTLGDLVEMFPEKEAALMQQIGFGASQMTDQLKSSPVEYIEAWTNELVGWKIKDLVLGVEDNPHFDREGEDVTGAPDPTTGQPGQTSKVYFNHFKKPRIPFILLKYFSLGTHVMDETSLIEQGIGLQDWINKRKRQIGANADSTNGHWVSSGDFISQEEFQKIEGGIDEKIWLENGLPGDGLQKVTGKELPSYIYSDLLDSRNAIDNLMSTHNTTRGESSGNKTLGQDIMTKDQDYGRIDGYVRDGIEKFASDWYEYMYHMHLVYQKEEKAIAVPEDDDFESENIFFSRKRVPIVMKKDGSAMPVPMVLRVKQGSTLPLDEVAEYTRAIQMKDILSPLDYFKKVGEPNPRELTKNLLIWTHDPFMLFKDDKDIQMLQQRMAQQKPDTTKVNVSVRADATTPAGATILESKGLIPQGSAKQMMASGLLLNPSPSMGKGPINADMPPGPQPEGTPQGEAAPSAGGKEGLINAMTQMLRSGEAQQLMGQAPQG